MLVETLFVIAFRNEIVGKLLGGLDPEEKEIFQMRRERLPRVVRQLFRELETRDTLKGRPLPYGGLGYRAASQGDPPEGTPLDDPPPTEPGSEDEGGGVIQEWEDEVQRPWRDFRNFMLEPPNEKRRRELPMVVRRLVDTAAQRLVPAFIGAVVEQSLTEGSGSRSQGGPRERSRP